ncbi:MAG TPA: hypothetical protein VFO16_17705 [Pseudonocardiaceae bacterium]|nr:hypothetical protein [Pseudonocardiaceae bacterium]
MTQGQRRRLQMTVHVRRAATAGSATSGLVAGELTAQRLQRTRIVPGAFQFGES